MTAIRLLVADDHEIVRLGIRTLLTDTDIHVVAEAETGESALSQTLENAFDVVLLDVRLPDIDGLSILERIKLDKPEQSVVIFALRDNPTHVARAVAHGASGFLLKESSRDVIIRTLQQAVTDDGAWTRNELRRVTGALATPRVEGNTDVPLTQRESEVLKQLAAGRTNKEIAQKLHISNETVKEHVQHILRKVGVTDRTQAAVWAVRNGMA